MPSFTIDSVERAFAEYRHHTQVLRPVLDEDETTGQRFVQRGIDDQLGWQLVLDSDQRRRTANVPGALRVGGIGGENGTSGHGYQVLESDVHVRFL